MPYNPTPFQRKSSALFGKTAEDLRRRLVGPVRLPGGITEQDLEKLDRTAKEAWKTGRGNDWRKMVQYGEQFFPEQKARWLIVQEAKAELKRKRSGKS